MDKDLPFVSVITPTYNRRKFIPQLLRYFDYQTYPAEKMELIIADDGTDSVSDLVKGRKRVSYLRLDEKIPLGKKRNILNDTSKGDIIVCMDDDDYYPPERVKHAVESLSRSDRLIAGCTVSMIYFADLGYFIRTGPFHQNHILNGTMAYKKSYIQHNRYDETKEQQEEPSFTKNFTNPAIQLDPKKTILIISHSSNVFDKKQLLKHNPEIHRLQLNEFVKDEQDQIFYKSLKSDPLTK